jgi:hypothetical protein
MGADMKTSQIQQILVDAKIPRHSGRQSDVDKGREILKKQIPDILELMKAMVVLQKWVGI